MTSYLRGRALRATALDGCGNVVLGPDSKVTSKGFVSVGATSNTEAGEAITVLNADGETCVNDQPTPKFLNYGLEIIFCDVDPAMFHLLTGQPLVLDAQGNPTGLRVNSKVDLGERGFALELWTRVAGVACAPGTSQIGGYMLWPFVKGGLLGDLTVENGAINFTITGATTRDGVNWGVGPYDVTLDEDGEESPLLEPADAYDHYIFFPTYVAPPAIVEGGQAIGVPATGATAGSPATLAPANSYAPLNLADLVDGSPVVVASPTTAWTGTQRLILRDGSAAKWSGTAWVAYTG